MPNSIISLIIIGILIRIGFYLFKKHRKLAYILMAAIYIINAGSRTNIVKCIVAGDYDKATAITCEAMDVIGETVGGYLDSVAQDLKARAAK